MNKTEQTKEQLIEAVITLISLGHDPEELPVRQIAEEAGVTFGLINYHFGTKQKLIQIACERIFGSKIGEMMQSLYKSEGDPVERLRRYLKYATELSTKLHKSIMRVITKQELLEGEFETVTHFIPFMKEIYPNASEDELKLLAFQLIIPIQVAFIRYEHMSKYFSLKDSGPSWFIDQTIDNLLKGR